MPRNSQLLTKAEFAAAMSVSAAAVSNWIKRGVLTAPALRPDGRINLEAGRRQVSERIEPSKLEPSVAADRETDPVDREIKQQSARAKAVTATITAEQARRKLAADRGLYMLREDAERQWAKEVADLMRDIEFWVLGLARDLPLDVDMAARLRSSWRALRTRLAAGFRTRAETAPPYVADPGRG